MQPNLPTCSEVRAGLNIVRNTISGLEQEKAALERERNHWRAMFFTLVLGMGLFISFAVASVLFG